MFIDTTGAVVLKELKQLETVVAGFKAQVTAACALTDRCSTDQSGLPDALKAAAGACEAFGAGDRHLPAEPTNGRRGSRTGRAPRSRPVW